MTMRPKKLLAIAVLLIFAASSSFAAPSPTESMKSTIDFVIATLADKSKPKSARRAIVIEKVRSKFDFNTMSQFVLSTTWRKVNETQKKAFIEKFSSTLEQTYASRIEEYSSETVKYLGEEIRGDKAKLDTAIISQGKDIPITYKLLLAGDNWLIYDVVIEGVSLARNYNATYGEIIHKEGFDNLLRRMDEKLAQRAEEKKK
ncbi:ABC transporter substrate-binding protein [bacterium]|nr:MAG: ABC transporter substrate-binding protein [bacterium]